MDIGLMISKWRINNNMSKPELAKLVGCSVRGIEYWESGQRNISLQCLDKVLKALNITIKLGNDGELF